MNNTKASAKNRPIVENESVLTNIIFESMTPLEFIDLDFGDDGNNVFVTDEINGNEYEIIVKKL